MKKSQNSNPVLGSFAETLLAMLLFGLVGSVMESSLEYFILPFFIFFEILFRIVLFKIAQYCCEQYLGLSNIPFRILVNVLVLFLIHTVIALFDTTSFVEEYRSLLLWSWLLLAVYQPFAQMFVNRFLRFDYLHTE